MPVVSRRRTEESRVVRRRDRDAVEETEDEYEDEDTDVTERPTRRATKAAKKTTTTTTRRRRDPEPEPEEDYDEDDEDEAEDEDDEDEEEDEDDEEEAPRARKAPPKKAAAKKAAPRRTRAHDEEDDDEDDEDESPRRNRRAAKLPAGFHTGWQGVEETESSFGDRLKITNQPQLIAFLEDEPFLSVRQHWVSSGVAGQPDLPHVCPGTGCPLCACGSRSSQATMFNVVLLSGGEPTNKILQGARRANEALKEAATNRSTGRIKLKGALFSVSKSGKNQQSQTNFAPVKRRDLEEDWPEVLEFFELDDLDTIITEAAEHVFDAQSSGVRITPMRELKEMAKYLTEED